MNQEKLSGKDNTAKVKKRIDPPRVERNVLKLWQEEKIFEKSKELHKDAPAYSFYDGPPYATGSPHYGHVLQTTIKDSIIRYWYMRGFRVDRRVGWDCHGLPVENLVEKELGLKEKSDIEKMGIEKFNQACRESVFRAVDEFQNVLQRMGRWADYSRAYATLEPDYIESVWWVFKQVWEAGLVYRGFRSSPYCPRCATPLSNFETAQGYKETEDPAVTVKLAVKKQKNTFLLIWTTTPWTLPGNAAAAVNPELDYAKLKVGDEYWILAKQRIEETIKDNYKVVEEFEGKELVGLQYQPLYEYIEPDLPAYRVEAADFVTAEEGTGVVHVAPAFGEDDLNLAKEKNLPVISVVNNQGRFVKEVAPWAGKFVKEADTEIIEDLKERGLLVKNEKYLHQYPFCWRCDTPLIYYATDSWFISVSQIRDQLIANNQQINWVPAHLREGRFGQGLEEAPDWAISRNRYWGTPIPVWVCEECGKEIVVGSMKELEEAGGDISKLHAEGKGKPDLHRPYIDNVELTCPECGKKAKRVPEIFDVWMDSGSMPYAQWHYPFENKELVEKTFPADFIAEALDQTRGWFYTLHVLSAILTQKDTGLGKDKPAFKNAVVSGLVLAEDGKKLSKRLKNYPEVSKVVENYGADTLRLYLLSSTTIGEDYKLSEKLIADFYRRYTLPLYNVHSFWKTYAELSARKPGTKLPQELHLLDRWILAKLRKLTIETNRHMENYRLDQAARGLVSFVEELSNWYVRRSRKRFAPDNAENDKEAAFGTLEHVLSRFALISAPFTPFTAEHLCRELAGEDSPHLQEFPQAEEAKIEQELIDEMESLREAASAGLQIRAGEGIKVRQPLAKMVLAGKFEKLKKLGEEGLRLIKDELNVKAVKFTEKEECESNFKKIQLTEGKGCLDVELTEELEQEGVLRDLIRHVQELRKQSGLSLNDFVELNIDSASPLVKKALEKYGDELMRETRSRLVTGEVTKKEGRKEVNVGGAIVFIALGKSDRRDQVP